MTRRCQTICSPRLHDDNIISQDANNILDSIILKQESMLWTVFICRTNTSIPYIKCETKTPYAGEPGIFMLKYGILTVGKSKTTSVIVGLKVISPMLGAAVVSNPKPRRIYNINIIIKLWGNQWQNIIYIMGEVKWCFLFLELFWEIFDRISFMWVQEQISNLPPMVHN